MMRRQAVALLAGASTLAAARPSFAQAAAAASTPPMRHVAWSRQASLYQVNIRQYTAEGTLAAFRAELPRLQAMGVDMLWLMPVQPIGRLHRKGSLGSYYSISDYTAVNPEFGTLEDFRALVRDAHGRGMKVLLDWVANHTAWDHPWAGSHKDWYQLNEQGELFPVTFQAGTPQVEYWTDVIALNYANPGLREAMIAAMAFWVREADIDGFRCDVASLVPTDFWERARRELDAIKPLFMLAESNARDLHRSAFDMTYSWDLLDAFKAIGKGQPGAATMRAWLAEEPRGYPADAYRMRFTSNHDVNSWHGTDIELYGDAWQALTVLSFTLPGLPLIYGGQESRLTRRLAFFEKDPIDWKTRELQGFYTTLLSLKRRHPALANGEHGGSTTVLDAGHEAVFAFRRERGGDALTVAVNLSAQPVAHRSGGVARDLPAWGWQIDLA